MLYFSKRTVSWMTPLDASWSLSMNSKILFKVNASSSMNGYGSSSVAVNVDKMIAFALEAKMVCMCVSSIILSTSAKTNGAATSLVLPKAREAANSSSSKPIASNSFSAMNASNELTKAALCGSSANCVSTNVGISSNISLSSGSNVAKPFNWSLMMASISLPVICLAAQLTVPNNQASGKLPMVSFSSFNETASVVASSLKEIKIRVLKVNEEYFK